MDTLVKPIAADALRSTSVGRRTPLIDGIEKVTGRARYTADLGVRRRAGRQHPAQPRRAWPDPLDRHHESARHARRARGDHRRGLRRALRRDPDRAERMGAGARQGALPRRADGRGRGGRRCERERSTGGDRRRRRAAAGVLPGRRRARRRRGAAARRQERQHRARGRPDLRRCRRGLRGERSRARAALPLRRSRAWPDRAERRDRDVGAGERAPDEPVGDAGAVLPAPDAGSMPRYRQRPDPRRQALRRRRLRPSRRAARRSR